MEGRKEKGKGFTYVKIFIHFKNNSPFCSAIITFCYLGCSRFRTTVFHSHSSSALSHSRKPRPPYVLFQPFVLPSHPLCAPLPYSSVALHRSKSYRYETYLLSRFRRSEDHTLSTSTQSPRSKTVREVVITLLPKTRLRRSEDCMIIIQPLVDLGYVPHCPFSRHSAVATSLAVCQCSSRLQRHAGDTESHTTDGSRRGVSSRALRTPQWMPESAGRRRDRSEIPRVRDAMHWDCGRLPSPTIAPEWHVRGGKPLPDRFRPFTGPGVSGRRRRPVSTPCALSLMPPWSELSMGDRDPCASGNARRWSLQLKRDDMSCRTACTGTGLRTVPVPCAPLACTKVIER